MINQQYNLLTPKLHAFSAQYLYHKSHLLETLKSFHKQTLIQDIYFTERCYKLVLNQRITQVELFGCGFKKFYHRKNISPYLKLDKIIVVSNLDSEGLQELHQIQYLFPEIHILSLQTTSSSDAKLLKNSQIRKSLKSIKEINLNFYTFLEGAHSIDKMEKSYLFKNEQERKEDYKYHRPTKQSKIAAYRSFLLSYHKIYEYELNYLKTSDVIYNKFVEQMEKELSESLQLMKKHEQECKSLDKVSSPKIKCLILNRQIVQDLISPLIYGYYYGPLTQEFIDREKLIEGAEKLSSKGKMYNELFQQDFDESAAYIQKLANDKTVLEGPLQANYFYKAKHIIVSYQDPSPIELSLHISCWKTNRQYGEYRIKPAALQQDIANRNDEYDRKVSNAGCINRIKKWILESNQDDAELVTENELIKLVMLTQMTGELWFFHHKSLKKLINDEVHQMKYENFMGRKKSQIPINTLKQKYQPKEEERSQLYRHEPKLVPICQKWISFATDHEKDKVNGNTISMEFKKKSINNDIIRNRDSKLVLLIDGILGYNQLAMLRRMIKETTAKQVSILAESFCNTQQYADYLSRPLSKSKKRDNN